MEIDAWRERWQEGRISFHEGKPNALLEAHVDLLQGRKRVLVPLSGKSVDLVFLARHVEAVAGVEGVDLACSHFFADHDSEPVVESAPPFRRFRAAAPGAPLERIELFCGDFFEATRERVGAVDAVYDRAALIAVEPALRARYVDVVRRLLLPGARVLLVAPSYAVPGADPHALGPPFPLFEADVRSLFRDGFTVNIVEVRDTDVNPRLQAAGVGDARETLYRIDRP